MLKATGNLFGTRVRAATALAAVISGPVIALGAPRRLRHAAVGFAGCAFWAITEFLRRDDRAWLGAAALLYALAGLAKYPALMFAGPPLVALVIVERGRAGPHGPGPVRRSSPARCCSSTSSPTARSSTAFEAFRTQNNPNFHVGRNQIVYSQVYLTAVPLLLAARRRVPRSRTARVAFALLTGLIGAPVYHLLTGNPSGDQKHVVFGLLFILPLIGVTISLRAAPLAGGPRGARADRARRRSAPVQVTRIDEGWADLRGSAARAHARRSPRAKNCSRAPPGWTPPISTTGAGSPLRTTSTTSRASSTSASRFNVCRFDWFIEVPGGEPWPPAIRRAMERCGASARSTNRAPQ